MPNKNDFNSSNSIGYHELKRLQYLRMRLARIERVDPDKMTCDIRYLSEVGGRTKTIITTAYWSFQAFMGAMPEEGTTVVVGFYHNGADMWLPVVLAYMPSAPVQARRGDSWQVGLPSTGSDDSAREGFSFVQRMRLRKIYPGQLLMASKEGSDIVVSDDILLSNSMNNEILLRSDDQTIILNAVAQVINTPGGFIKFGPITRNEYMIDEHIYRDGNSVQSSEDYDGIVAAHLSDPITLSNGKKVNFVCDIPANPNHGGNPFTEHRTDIYEFNQLLTTLTEDTDHWAVGTHEPPMVTQIMGTLVGADPKDISTYARILKASVFRSLSDPKGVIRLDEAKRSGGVNGENETRTTAVAYYLKVGGYQQAISKTGNVVVSIPGSTAGGVLGEGHSLDAALEGSAKVTLGKDRAKGNSLHLNAEGGVTAIVGQENIDDAGAKGRSVSVTAQGAVNLEVNGVDDNGYSQTTLLNGKKRDDIGGDYDLEIKGNYNLTIHGVINESILGKKVENYIGDRSITTGGSIKETVIEKKQLQLGQGRSETIASGGTDPNADSLTILAGNKVVNVALGNITETVVAGNWAESIPAGNKTVTVGTGTFNVTVGTGAVTVSTGSGSVTIGTAAGAMTLTATGVVQISGGTINVTGGAVNLGPIPGAGVVTAAHPCLVTGAPHIGSLTVKASP